MGIYKPYIKKSNDGAVDELPLYATTAGEVVNLGYYDTISENSDGTYTITRQTGYHNISNDLIKNGAYRQTQAGHGEYGADSGIHNLPIISGSKNFINNLLPVRDNGEVYGGSIGISITENGMCWVNLGNNYTTTEQYREYFLKNNIYVQYKLATSTTEKVEKNHYARYNQNFILEHNKSEAERSANLLNTFDRSKIPSNSSLYAATLNSDGSYTGTSTSDSRTWTYTSSDFKLHLTKGTYTFSITGTISTNQYTQMEIFDSNNNLLCGLYRPNNFKNSFALTSDTDIGIVVKAYDSTDLKIMLNKGLVALPYQPYEGKVVHMKDLDNLPKLYNHFLIITFTHSSRTYKCKVNILSSVSTKITDIDNLARVCRGAINIYETNSDNNYYWSMPAEGALSSNETSTSQNYVIFRLFIYYDYKPSGQKLVYAYYINQTDNGSNFGIANSFSGQSFSDTVKTIYGGK